MFPVKHDDAALRRAADWAQIPLTMSQIDRLRGFGGWLVGEAIAAGALGPAEKHRIVDRHLADSLVFAAAWDLPPNTLIDVGSGAGLPGIPLAIAFPDTEVTLLDRSQRRADLLRRAVRILDLDNASVIEGDVGAAAADGYAGATFRASLPPDQAMKRVRRLLLADGVAVIGIHRGFDRPALPTAPSGVVLELLETPPGILDSPAWHLRMTLR